MAGDDTTPGVSEPERVSSLAPPPPPPPQPAPERPPYRPTVRSGIEPAPIGRRVLAAVIDAVPLTLLAVACIAGLDRRQDRFVVWVVLVLAFWMVVELGGSSLGKRLMQLKVVDADTGEPPSLAQVAIRTGVRVIDALPFFYLLGYLIASTDAYERRRLGDVVSGTMVVDVEHDQVAPSMLAPALGTLLAVVGSLVVIAVAASEEPPLVAPLRYEVAAEPFARTVADAFTAEQFNAVEAAYAGDAVERFGAPTRAELEQAHDDLNRFARVGRAELVYDRWDVEGDDPVEAMLVVFELSNGDDAQTLEILVLDQGTTFVVLDLDLVAAGG